MASKSHIEWTEQTWNPVTGCTKISPGCKHCYAETLEANIKNRMRRTITNKYTSNKRPAEAGS